MTIAGLVTEALNGVCMYSGRVNAVIPSSPLTLETGGAPVESRDQLEPDLVPGRVEDIVKSRPSDEVSGDAALGMLLGPVDS